jgi:hypothetical protein
MSHILRYIFVIAVAYDGRRLGAGKVTLKASLSSTRFLSEHIGRRTIIAMLLLAALAVFWNLLGQ